MVREVTNKSIVLASIVLAGVPLAGAPLHAAEEAASDSKAAAAMSNSERANSDGANSDGALEEVVVQGRFLQTTSTSAMKLNTPVLDTPFSVSAYSESFLKSLETQSLQDTYNYMNGVKKAGQTAYDLTLRGFKTSGDDKNAIMVDGLPGLTARYSSPPTVGLDRVELVKGPMSVLYGQIQPGGFVNMITKKPQAEASRVIDIRAQSYAMQDGPHFGDANGVTGSVDLTGPIDADKRFLYRFVGEYDDRDGFRNNSFERGPYLAPSLSWVISDDTLANISYEYRKVKGSFDTGVIAPGTPVVNAAGAFTGAVAPATSVGNVPRTTTYQEPGDYRVETGQSLSGSFVHHFEGGPTWNTAARSVYSESFQDEHSPTGQAVTTAANALTTPNFTTDPPGTQYIVRRARRLGTRRTYNFVDSNLVVSANTGPIRHQFVAGVNGGRDTTWENRFGFVSGSGCTGKGGQLTAAQCASQNIAIFDPIYGLVSPAVGTASFGSASDKLNQTDTGFLTNSLGLYLSDLISLGEHWKLSLGARATHEDTVTREDRTKNTRYESTASKNLIPSAGLLYEPSKHWTLYTSYSQSYVPAQAQFLNRVGQPGTFKPITGKQVELGVKTEDLFQSKLSGSVAVFRIKREDTLIAVAPADQVAYFGGACTGVPDGESCYAQGTQEESKGAELELNAHPIQNWQTTLGYSYIDATVSKAPIAAQQGSRLLNTARNSGNLWTRYDVPAGFARGLGIGVGVVYSGDRAGTVPTSTDPNVLLLPSYLTVDLAVNYIVRNYAFNLKVGNLFDRMYYESIGQGINGVNQLAPGAGRLVTLSMRATF
jgi:iron complex outermembrane receptor protein